MKYITAYNEDWPGRFERIAQFLRDRIPSTCRIHHIGSTSIPGMPAKDIVDLIVECPDGAMPTVIAALDDAGYDHQGDLGIPMREAFRQREGSMACELPRHYLYACESRSPELFKERAFRDYLIAHAKRAKWLARQKIAADGSASSRTAYIEGKSDAYVTVTGEALAWVYERPRSR